MIIFQVIYAPKLRPAWREDGSQRSRFLHDRLGDLPLVKGVAPLFLEHFERVSHVRIAEDAVQGRHISTLAVNSSGVRIEIAQVVFATPKTVRKHLGHREPFKGALASGFEHFLEGHGAEPFEELVPPVHRTGYHGGKNATGSRGAVRGD